MTWWICPAKWRAKRCSRCTPDWHIFSSPRPPHDAGSNIWGMTPKYSKHLLSSLMDTVYFVCAFKINWNEIKHLILQSYLSYDPCRTKKVDFSKTTATYSKKQQHNQKHNRQTTWQEWSPEKKDNTHTYKTFFPELFGFFVAVAFA